jgi:hypothetical protein
MDRPLVLVGTLVVGLLLVYGVATAGGDEPVPAPAPAAPPTPAVPAAPPVRPLPPSPAGAGVATSSDALSFDVLTSYDYVKGMANLPDAIKALDGKTVTMRGFLLPLYEFDDIHEFVLVANHMSCCFGIPSGMNGQVYVKLAGAGRGLPNTNEPIEVRGTFHAREREVEGYVLSIYEVVDATAKIKGY